jgi:hypothetical protein
MKETSLSRFCADVSSCLCWCSWERARSRRWIVGFSCEESATVESRKKASEQCETTHSRQVSNPFPYVFYYYTLLTLNNDTFLHLQHNIKWKSNTSQWFQGFYFFVEFNIKLNGNNSSGRLISKFVIFMSSQETVWLGKERWNSDEEFAHFCASCVMMHFWKYFDTKNLLFVQNLSSAFVGSAEIISTPVQIKLITFDPNFDLPRVSSESE